MLIPAIPGTIEGIKSYAFIVNGTARFANVVTARWGLGGLDY